MKRTLHLLLFGVACLAISASSALGAVFERDWKTPGDGLLTYDDVNQRLWLDVPVSLMIQFPGDSLEDRFHVAIAELERGGLFDGFTLAKAEDLLGLAQSGGIDISTDDYFVNDEATSRLVSLLGPTFVTNNAFSTTGLIDAPPSLADIAVITPVDFAGIRFLGINESPAEDGGIASTGLMLYRQVPEPAVMLLLLLATFSLFSYVRYPQIR